MLDRGDFIADDGLQVKRLRSHSGCGIEFENFRLDLTKNPLITQYGKEWSSKVSGTDCFRFVPLHVFCEQSFSTSITKWSERSADRARRRKRTGAEAT